MKNKRAKQKEDYKLAIVVTVEQDTLSLEQLMKIKSAIDKIKKSGAAFRKIAVEKKPSKKKKSHDGPSIVPAAISLASRAFGRRRS